MKTNASATTAERQTSIRAAALAPRRESAAMPATTSGSVASSATV